MWSIEQPEWTCKIDEGSAGLVSCLWAPDSRHILTTTDFQLRMTLWSLTSKSISYIKYPKLVQVHYPRQFCVVVFPEMGGVWVFLEIRVS